MKINNSKKALLVLFIIITGVFCIKQPIRAEEITYPGQIIWRDEQGTLIGGTEPRADGGVAAW